ncbi:MAG: helical backbone metal receptor [Bryobacteraceae bacterium]|nr:helical backbone metal receptor [Bryobacteraceae bacterium]
MRCTVILLFANLLAAQQRVVSLAPSATEMLYAMGWGDRVVGVTKYCHYPPEARKKTQVGSYLRPSLEAIAGLKPDLIISDPTTTRVTLPGVAMAAIERKDLAAIEQSLHNIAKAMGDPARAVKLAGSMRRDLDAIRARNAGKAKRKTMFVVGRNPGQLTGLIVVGRDSYLNELIALAGGQNIFADAPVSYPKISVEEILARQPEVIIDMGDMADTDAVPPGHLAEVRALYNKLPTKRQRVFAVASDIFVVPGPRVVDAAREFEKMIQGKP